MTDDLALVKNDGALKHSEISAADEDFLRRFERVEDALENQAQMQQVQNEMLRELLKMIRISTPCTPQQARYLQDAVRAKTAAIITENGIARRGARTVAATIRKSVFRRYGIGGFAELPRSCYEAALGQIDGWYDGEMILAWMRRFTNAD